MPRALSGHIPCHCLKRYKLPALLWTRQTWWMARANISYFAQIIYIFHSLSFVVFFTLFEFRSAKQFSTLIGNKAHYFIIHKKHYKKHLNMFTLFFVYTNKNRALAALETYSLVNIFFYWTSIGAFICNVVYRVFIIINGKL